MSLALKGWATPAQLTQIAADLTDTLTLLRKDGWTQGQMGSPDKGWCMVGALDDLLKQHCSCDNVAIACRATLAASAFHRVIGVAVTTFNDDPDRTFPDIEAALLRVIDQVIREAES